jgi:hypothetical protein
MIESDKPIPSTVQTAVFTGSAAGLIPIYLGAKYLTMYLNNSAVSSANGPTQATGNMLGYIGISFLLLGTIILMGAIGFWRKRAWGWPILLLGNITLGILFTYWLVVFGMSTILYSVGIILSMRSAISQFSLKAIKYLI